MLMRKEKVAQMKCEQIQPNLLDYGKGLLSRPESEETRAHIENCAECAALLEEEMAFSGVLAGVPDEEPPDDVWTLIRAKTRPRRFAPLSFLRGAFSVPARRAVAVTTAMAALVATAYSLKPEAPSPVTVKQPTAVVAVVDDPLGRHADAMIDVIEDM